MDMLRITGLCKRFGDKEVLKGLDLTVPEGSIFGFIGVNGAGKTTAMKTVLGLLKADSGEIFVNEINTIPGSLSFYLWEASGLSFAALMDELVRIALKRQRRRKQLHFSFDTNLLSTAQLGGAKGSKGTKR